MHLRIGMHIAQGWLKPLLIAATSAYLTAASALLWAGRNSLLAPVGQYRPRAEWTVTATSEARIRALLDTGHDFLALLYFRLELFSASFLCAALLIGLVVALRRGRRSEADPVTLMMVALVSIILYAAFSGGAVLCSLLCRSSALLIDIAGTPAYWFATMIAATTLIGWTAALLTHDVAALVLTRRTHPSGRLVPSQAGIAIPLTPPRGAPPQAGLPH